MVHEKQFLKSLFITFAERFYGKGIKTFKKPSQKVTKKTFYERFSVAQLETLHRRFLLVQVKPFLKSLFMTYVERFSEKGK